MAFKLHKCIIKESPQNLQLLYQNKVLDEKKSLSVYGSSFDILNPMVIGLSLKMDNGEFEPLDITPYSEPPLENLL
ncbi:uncharacterized protein LOC112600244 [Melanaphis sacchari]|uniref:uncharacterized protein LOC112600244 n=1 Tax=Melanaphis sacchari TaxID=742174 RepID=UPI000DC14931|nr:uncharacterized protein LOC112600244 [Melanaphis sacchari]